MVKIVKIILYFQLVLISLSSYANRHEHFLSWPTVSSIETAYLNTFGTSLGDLDISILALGDVQNNNPLSRGPQIYHYFYETLNEDEQVRIRKRLNIPADISDKDLPLTFGSKLDGKSLDEVIELTRSETDTRPTSELRKKFFKLLNDSPANAKSYAKVEQMRINLFQYLKKNNPKFKSFLLDTYKRSIDKIPLDSRKFIGFSVSGGFFDSDLQELKNLFSANGTDAHFYLSVARGKLKKPNSAQLTYLEKLNRSLNEGWGNGIDLTGSLYEKNEVYAPDHQTNLSKNLRLITSVLSNSNSPNSVLRFHAFEAANQGTFYDEIFELIKEKAEGEAKFKKSPFVFSIGHIAGLNDENIEKLEKIKALADKNKVPLNIVFDANYSSNEKLQGASPQKIASTIKKLQEAGFEVGLGSDGTGILGRKSSVPWQANYLFDGGVDENSIDKLLEASDRAPVCDMNQYKKIIMESLK